MIRFIYRFALVLAAVTFVSCLINPGITLFTTLFRTAGVFIGVLFVFYIGGHLLRLGIQVMEIHEPEKNDIEAQEPAKK